MKKLISSIIIAITCMISVVGCKTVPTADKIESTALAIGYASGMVANSTKIDDVTRNTVIEIIGKVDNVVPQTNQTFAAAWTPIATEHINKLIENGKITVAQGNLIFDAFKVACNGLDYLFDVRYPTARQYEDLVSAAVHGFTTGFLTTFKPVNVMSAAPVEYDKEAYDWLSASK